jgi:hypothetical protein
VLIPIVLLLIRPVAPGAAQAAAGH